MTLFLTAAAFIFGALLSMPEVPHRYLSVILALTFAIINAPRILKTRKLTKTHVHQMYILAVYALYHLLKSESSFFYFILSKISGGFTSFIGLLIGRPVSMDITYSGIDVVFLFLIAFISLFLMYQKNPIKKILVRMPLILLAWGLYIGVWTVLAESSMTLGLNLLEPVTGPLDYRVLLFILLLIPFMISLRGFASNDDQKQMRRAVKLAPAAMIVLCAAVSVVIALGTSKPVQSDTKQILFWDTGIDFSVPEEGKYGLDYVGMFGVLPHYLNQNGYLCRTAEEIDESILNETDVLVIFNPMRSPNDDELASIWRFVEDGGSVLAVGDHTGHEQVRLPLNKVLTPAAIAFNFDSAIPFKSLWAEDYRLRTSPVFGNADGRQVQMVVGASLDLGARAKPLVIGREGFSDAGDLSNTADGYLGDMLFNRGERIGDLPLAAESSYGNGKFMAFGDTTPFQNTVIPYSYPFVDNVFAYLSDNNKQSTAAWQDDGFFKASCVIDASRIAGISRDKSGNAADGLISNAMRAGFMPYLNQQDSFAEIITSRDDIKLIILIEPALSLTEDELRTLEAFMSDGGTVILSAGYDSPKASAEIAARFGFSFDPMPIGRIAPDQNPDMAFWNACPVLYEGAFPQDDADGVRSLMEIWEYSTITQKNIGAGALYILSDPDFLKNKNIENVDTYREGNILYIDSLISDILEGRR